MILSFLLLVKLTAGLFDSAPVCMVSAAANHLLGSYVALLRAIAERNREKTKQETSHQGETAFLDLVFLIIMNLLKLIF